MSDLIDRQATIDTLDKHLRTTDVPVSYPGIISALTEWLNELPSAQPDSKELSGTHKALDTVSRQAVIEAINKIFPADPMRDDYTQGITCGAALANIYVAQLPSAQPETHEERTETHACDLISRQAAIDAVESMLRRKFGIGGDLAEITLAELPSAQPEPCVDTIDALNESIKHFDDMAEECRRNANIERNDYMDMRDDAAEYRQLSIWLNELKWLRERFQSQPDLSEYSDKLWKAAYERGKAEAQQRWIPCSERLPENKSYVLTTIYIPGRQPHARSGWFEDGLFMNDNGDTWKSTDREVCAWMPLPEPYREGE